MSRSRRLRYYWVSEVMIWELVFARWLLPECATFHWLSGVPEDAVLEGVHHDPFRRSFLFLLCHPDFEEVDGGAEIPVVGPMHFEIVRIDRRADGSVRAYEALRQENLRLRLLLGDRRLDEPVLDKAYQQGVLEERERCAGLVENADFWQGDDDLLDKLAHELRQRD